MRRAQRSSGYCRLVDLHRRRPVGLGDDWYRVPTPEELHEQFLRWRASRMEGYFVFAWHWPANDSTLWLANHPELQAQLAVENGQ